VLALPERPGPLPLVGMASHRQEVEAILAGAAAEHRALLEHVSPALRASLPVDATGITQAIGHLADALGLSERLRGEQQRGHQANPAVLHGRVFGRTPLSADTVVAAFADGARVRASALAQLATAAGGDDLEREVAALLAEHPPTADGLAEAYAAQERAAVLIASRLDG
jgi:hypothetical protein